MKVEINSVVPASREATWALVMDIPRAASCIPGIKDVTPDGEGRYQATLTARVGPMGMSLSGTITVLSQDAEAGEARFLVEANDRRVGGGVKTNMTMKVTAKSPNETELEIVADTTFLGRLGELGQPIIRRKARNTLEEFSKNLSKLLASEAE
ncbi:MAG: SRPBCC family protein [Chloroflexi bacterium]|nr:SRPBCC family protein [Chloroflexota bacterium]MCI0800819.1 SRPBCC family protein [Chloroflexota bacterium]MCI0810912.1 SRPBCC family protein [Chloroflexota bacterium]MCI0829234.1 SRPBCC family protein [Chloroflexota bacterium]MCI0846941.1 SRPBCC family protein [Chloroflexota bacterium]